MAAPTPIGANIMTMFVNLNIVSDKLSQKERTGWRLLSLTKANAIAKTMLKTTICRTWPSATDFAIFSGKMWRMMSDALCGGGALNWEVVAGWHVKAPTAFMEMDVAGPINNASDVKTFEKNTGLFIPTPTLLPAA